MQRQEAIQLWANRWRNLRAWGRELSEVQIEYRSRSEEVGSYSTGLAFPVRRRIVITHGSDMSDALACVLHELAHLAVDGREWHGRKWRLMFLTAVGEVTSRPLHGGEAWTYRLLQCAAEDAVRAWWRASGFNRLWKMAKD